MGWYGWLYQPKLRRFPHLRHRLNVPIPSNMRRTAYSRGWAHLAKLQKELEQHRRSAAEEVDRHSARVQKLESELMQVRQKLSGAEAALTEARAAGDQLRAHLDKALTKPTRKVSVKKVKS